MRTFSDSFRVALAAALLLSGKALAYDPLKVPEGEIVSKTFELSDVARDRAIPLRVYLPQDTKAAPVVLFSHGLGGSRDNNPYLGNHWAKRGYVVVFVQHAGSDENVWKKAEIGQRQAAMGSAVSLENLMARGRDIPVVIDALAKWNAEKDHSLNGRMDLDHLGMSGHSFGAITTQAVSGQSFAGGRQLFLESRIDASVMMSPSPPALGDPVKAFPSIKIPCLLMTGTLDDSPIGKTSPEERLKVFPNLTHAPAWQVVFDKGTHMSFGERDLAGRSEMGNRYHKPILALTTAFWDAKLRGDEEAAEWLNGPAARSVLATEDKWELNALAKETP